ncbi:MAG: hypothetical protein GOVbin3264_25 [Prokaryotic dsDNA virus sp.]|nr:MAG: hypothetical protein GOVbin3264_25 [Prokaryotic dsDNA virus sp.]|tara:strand:- start:514 stop:915 length:402 start_codon:yes stop_codon:yes gene_type:complete
MNKFFVNKETYKERLSICRSCDDYFKPTGTCTVCGCFMRIKASVSVMQCPKEYWLATKEHESPKELPKHLIKEVLNIYPDIKNRTIKDHETKKKLIELYNTIYDFNYKVTTNCRSCLSTVHNGIKKIYDEYKK